MRYVIPFEAVIPEDEEDARGMNALRVESCNFLTGFRWCLSIEEMHYGYSVGKIIGIFLARIKGQDNSIDDWLWVIVGDIPPAYLVTDDAETPTAALETYIELMSEWVEAVGTGADISEIIPVNAPPTKENADALRTRLEFLTEKIIPRIEEELEERCANDD